MPGVGLRNREPACRQLKAACNSVFINLTKTLDDFESKCFIEANTSFKIPASNAYMQKIINHCCYRCE